MPPNTIEITFEPEMRPDIKPSLGVPPPEGNGHNWKIAQSSMSLLAHVLTGIVVGISLMFAFRNGTSLGATPLHIVLCVIGYQLLMAQAILALSPEGGWSSKLSLVNRRRIHWILQILGSVLAIVGAIIKILDKNVNFDTWHGIFGLIATIFTGLSLLNGLTSLYAYELRKILPPNLSKITHICFGIIAFVAASVCLILGYEKNMFINWATLVMTNVTISFVVIFTAIIIINPLITFYLKTKTVFK